MDEISKDCSATKVCKTCGQTFSRNRNVGPKRWSTRMFCSRRCNTTNVVHGSAGRIPEYGIWQAMIQRCTNPGSQRWPGYGGRGITVCDRWLKSFSHFLIDMGSRPHSGFSLDRIDNDGNYEPDNCRWAPIATQARNTRTNRFLMVDGNLLTISEWAEKTGLKPNTIATRLRLGWSDERAVKEPISAKCRTRRAKP